jgi:hypothetical protein
MFREQQKETNKRAWRLAAVWWSALLMVGAAVLVAHFYGCKAVKGGGPICFPGAPSTPDDRCP